MGTYGKVIDFGVKFEPMFSYSSKYCRYAKFFGASLSNCAIMHFRINFVLDTPSDGLMDKLLISDDNVDQFVHSCAVQL